MSYPESRYHSFYAIDRPGISTQGSVKVGDLRGLQIFHALKTAWRLGLEHDLR